MCLRRSLYFIRSLKLPFITLFGPSPTFQEPSSVDATPNQRLSRREESAGQSNIIDDSPKRILSVRGEGTAVGSNALGGSLKQSLARRGEGSVGSNALARRGEDSVGTSALDASPNHALARRQANTGAIGSMLGSLAAFPAYGYDMLMYNYQRMMQEAQQYYYALMGGLRNGYYNTQSSLAMSNPGMMGGYGGMGGMFG